MKTCLTRASFVLSAVLLLPAVASAQQPDYGAPAPAAPQPAQTETPDYGAPGPAPAPQPIYAPPAPPPAPPQTAQTASPPQPVTSEAPVGERPMGFTMGLGIGYQLGGTDIFVPGIGSARFRLDTGLTFEPFVRLSTAQNSTEIGDTEITNAQNNLEVGSNVRLPLMGRGKVDLVAQGGATVSFVGDDPDGDASSSDLLFALSYGLSLEYWYNANWCLSFTAANPLFTYFSQSDDDGVNETNSSNLLVGAIWDPQVDMSLHLFY